MREKLQSSAVLTSCFILGIGALFIRYLIFPFVDLFCKENFSNKKSFILHYSWKLYVKILNVLNVVNVQSNDFEKLRNIKNSIIVSTHPTFIDVILLISIIPYTTCFVAKKLAKNPFFKGMVKSLFIIQDDNTEVWVKNAEKYLNSGFNVLIFPMGKRHNKDEFPKIRRSSAYLSEQTGKNISIIKITTDRDVFSHDVPIYKIGTKPARYKIEYLDEIDIEKWREKFPDPVDLRREITKYITKSLYFIK